MKNTCKILALVLIVMTVLMSFAAITASAADQPEKLYLTPSANWKQGNARFAAYFFGNGEKWVSMTDSDKDGVYEVAVPTDKVYPNVIFCRMNPKAAANNWNNKWNQTADLVIPTSGANHFTVKEGTWDKGGGTWSTYGSTCAHANLGPAATCTTAQTCLDCGDPVVSALGHSYNASHFCTRCENQATFVVAGSGAHMKGEWSPANTANNMTYDAETGTYTKVYENVAAGSYAFKCVRDNDTGWGTAYPAADKTYKVETAGSTVTITLKGTTVDVTVEVPHTHDYTTVVTAPTCTSAGYTTYTCECGDSYVSDEVAAPGHNYVAGVCSTCGEKDPEYKGPVVNVSDLEAVDPVVPGELVPGSGIFATEGMKITANKKSIDGFDFTMRLQLGGTMKVQDGGVYRGVKIVTTGPVDIVVYGMASSTDATGRYLRLTQLVEGELVDVAVTGEVGGAAIAKYVISVTEAGEYYLGSGDSGINVYYISALPHVHAHDAVVVAPTCTEAGYTKHTCSCGDTYNTDEVPATGHSYFYNVCLTCGAPNPEFAYNLATEGENTLVCNKWHLVDTAGHGFPYQFTMITIENSGLYSFTCDKLLGITFYTTEISSPDADFTANTGASWNHYVAVGEEPIRIEAGTYYIGYIFVAGEGEYKLNVSHVHSLVDVEAKAPTCMADGYTAHKVCEDCGYVEGRESIKNFGHTFVDGKCACGAEDPHYVAPVELTFWQKIVAWFTEMIQKITAIFSKKY